MTSGILAILRLAIARHEADLEAPTFRSNPVWKGLRI